MNFFATGNWFWLLLRFLWITSRNQGKIVRMPRRLEAFTVIIAQRTDHFRNTLSLTITIVYCRTPRFGMPIALTYPKEA